MRGKTNPDYDGLYDVFVTGDDVTASRIAKSLDQKGYSVFHEGGTEGSVPPGRLAAISRCQDFVVVLGEGASSALQEKNSPLRLELIRAVQRERNVIPVVTESANLEAVRGAKGLPEEICDFLDIPPANETEVAGRLKSAPRWNGRRTAVSALIAIAALLCGGFLWYCTLAGFPRTDSEREAASMLLASVERSVRAYAAAADGSDVSDMELARDEAAELVRKLDGTPVDIVSLVGIITAPDARRKGVPGGDKDALARNVEKVLSAVGGDESDKCRERVSKILEGVR